MMILFIIYTIVAEWVGNGDDVNDGGGVRRYNDDRGMIFDVLI
jgi:hypothetical protein